MDSPGDTAAPGPPAADAVRRGLRAGAAFILQNLVAERERWPLWLPVAMGTGVGLYFLVRFEPAPWWVPAAFGISAVVAALARRRPGALLAAILSGAMAAGFALAQIRSAVVAAPINSRAR